MFSKSRARVCQVTLGLMAILPLVSPAAHAVERLGHVLEIEGAWTANGQVLKRGDTVTVPLELRALAPLMLDEWTSTKRAPEHAAWLHEDPAERGDA